MTYPAKDAAELIARYPHPRSALLPLLHLVQSVDGYLSETGIAWCADQLDLTHAEVSAVATFYTQFKRRPNGAYNLGVCTTALCAIMGGDAIFERLSHHLGVDNHESTPDGLFTLERIECNAACDFAPVMMLNWEFMDNMTPEKAEQILDDLMAGKEVRSTRGPVITSWAANEAVLAGHEDGRADHGPSCGPPSRIGVKIAHRQGWSVIPEEDES